MADDDLDERIVSTYRKTKTCRSFTIPEIQAALKRRNFPYSIRGKDRIVDRLNVVLEHELNGLPPPTKEELTRYDRDTIRDWKDSSDIPQDEENKIEAILKQFVKRSRDMYEEEFSGDSAQGSEDDNDDDEEVVTVTKKAKISNPLDQNKLYIFKVELKRHKKLHRIVAVKGSLNCEQFMRDAILESFDFDYDHLYYASYVTGRRAFKHPQFDESGRIATSVKVADLELNIGDALDILYDFGDCWDFKVTLIDKKENPENVKVKILEKKRNST